MRFLNMRKLMKKVRLNKKDVMKKQIDKMILSVLVSQA